MHVEMSDLQGRKGKQMNDSDRPYRYYSEAELINLRRSYEETRQQVHDKMTHHEDVGAEEDAARNFEHYKEVAAAIQAMNDEFRERRQERGER